MDILLKNAKAYVERGHFVEAVHIKGERVHAVEKLMNSCNPSTKMW